MTDTKNRYELRYESAYSQNNPLISTYETLYDCVEKRMYLRGPMKRYAFIVDTVTGDIVSWRTAGREHRKYESA